MTKRIEKHRPFYEYFKTAASSIEMNVNGSVTAVDFKITAPDYGHREVERINFLLTDAALRYGQFGGLGGALTNGLEIKMFNASDVELYDFCNGTNIKANEDFTSLAGVDGSVSAAAGDDFLPVRWTLGKAGVRTMLYAGWYIRIRVQDNLTGLTKFRAMCQGVQK